jgi:hypothetical protein
MIYLITVPHSSNDKVWIEKFTRADADTIEAEIAYRRARHKACYAIDGAEKLIIFCEGSCELPRGDEIKSMLRGFIAHCITKYFEK